MQSNYFGNYNSGTSLLLEEKLLFCTSGCFILHTHTLTYNDDDNKGIKQPQYKQLCKKYDAVVSDCNWVPLINMIADPLDLHLFSN